MHLSVEDMDGRGWRPSIRLVHERLDQLQRLDADWHDRPRHISLQHDAK